MNAKTCCFSDWTVDHWQAIRQTTNRWWAGELDRPLLPIKLIKPSNQPAPAPKPFGRGLFGDINISVDQMVDQLAWQLNQQHYMTDAFPWVNMACSGAGVLAAMTGATLHPESYDDIWFRADPIKPINELHITLDEDNFWLKRLIAIGKQVHERWQGRVLVSTPDLGGVMDILSSFRPAEALLYDLYDEPDEVLRVIGEVETAWLRFFDLFNEQLSPMNPGYTSWCGIYSDVPYYIMQCDFCYMISTEMFDQFVKPSLIRTSEHLSRSFYHLDGKGQLPHLDSLLQIPTINGVQWIPGDGAKPVDQWPEVYEKILASGKCAQIMGDPSQLVSIMAQTQRCKGMTTGHWQTTDRAQAEHYLQILMHSCHTDSVTR